MPASKKRRLSSAGEPNGQSFQVECELASSSSANRPIALGQQTFEALLRPISVDTFVKHHYTHKIPLVIRGGSQRFLKIHEAMNDLDVASLLEDSPSERISIWTVGPDGKINTARVDATSAYTLYQAGHSVYCRAPENLENDLVESTIRSLGLGYKIDGGKVKSVIEGEVELFITKAGHFTQAHFDFQENWTVQLKGRKRWRLRPGVVNPVRGCTPHYAQKGGILDPAAEEQLKIHRQRDPSFHYGPIWEAPEAEVILGPGDFFYHPAGLYHTVESLEDSISINISLAGTTYADIISQGLRQLLMKKEDFSAMLQTQDAQATQLLLKTMLQETSSELSRLTPSCLIPPALMWGTLGTSNGGHQEAAAEEEQEEDEEAAIEVEMEEDQEDEDEVIEATSWPCPIAPKAMLQCNPLASFFAINDASPTDHDATVEEDEEEGTDYMIHVAFGNGELSSALRTKIKLPSAMATFVSSIKQNERFSPKDVPNGNGSSIIGRRVLGALLHYGVLIYPSS